MAKLICATVLGMFAATQVAAQTPARPVSNKEAQALLNCAVSYQSLESYHKHIGDKSGFATYRALSDGFYTVVYRTRPDRKTLVKDIERSVAKDLRKKSPADFEKMGKALSKSKRGRLNRICKRAAQPFPETQKFFK